MSFWHIYLMVTNFVGSVLAALIAMDRAKVNKRTTLVWIIAACFMFSYALDLAGV